MDDRQIDNFLRTILSSEQHEIDCAEFMDIIARYVDAEIASEGPPGDPRVPRHLDMCPDCADMYRSLKFVAALDARGQLPQADELWQALAEAARPTGATPTVPPPERPASVPPQDDKSARSAWLSGWGHSNLAWAGAAALIVFLAVGWWRSHEHANELETALYWVGHTEQVSFSKEDDGSWARVLYAPSEERFFVVAGDLPEKSLGKRIKCALIKKNGEVMIAGEFTVGADNRDWWLLDAGQPLSAFETLRLSDGQKDSIIQVQLAARN